MSDNGQHEEAGAPGEGKTRIVASFPRASEQSPRYQTLLVVLVQVLPEPSFHVSH
jgi:hypothetical protein